VKSGDVDTRRIKKIQNELQKLQHKLDVKFNEITNRKIENLAERDKLDSARA
jgi:hypothetical protein